ncbi:glutamine synthetase family protein [Paenibacillus alvei]|uniref:Glutamine synthetase n=1 Tax=Paenibacillus alvei TaxID=44250 RepID=A0A383RIS1_PAEAL|nr:glutamine synthetase family protein [Paenibacillus alvei]SYX86482.1 Glutamine synthetase [Paenibacillus alvei]
MQRSVPSSDRTALSEPLAGSSPSEDVFFIQSGDEVVEWMHRHAAEYLRLQFTDLFGKVKQFIIHRDEADAAFKGKVMFDGSSVTGYGGVDQSDLALHPDPTSFHVDTWHDSTCGTIATVFCDVRLPDGRRAQGCTRSMLKQVLREAKELGYSYYIGVEGEFFLYPLSERGTPIVTAHDEGGYCDLFPHDRGENVRLELLQEMRKQGFQTEASHHEVAPGQHEINFRFGEALRAADRWQMFKLLTKRVANQHGLHATFMPKPMSGQNGSALHCNQSLQDDARRNVFHDPHAPSEMSDTALYFIAGLLHHAKGMSAIANPVVNSYKRLMPGYEAPTHLTWSESNRSAMIRIPAARGKQTRIEYRTPDPTANPYLLFAVMLKSGLEGVKKRERPPKEASGDIHQSKNSTPYKWDIYPRDLFEALRHMEKDTIIQDVMGEQALNTYISMKEQEYSEYASQVHGWELTSYLREY